jgi:hypothetical protein
MIRSKPVSGDLRPDEVLRPRDRVTLRLATLIPERRDEFVRAWDDYFGD